MSRRQRRFSPEVRALESRSLLSVTLQVRYDFDTSGFFNVPERRASMERAARDVGDLLEDRLAAITPSGSNTWAAMFSHPVTGNLATVSNLVVPADTLIIYVGGRDFGGAEKGRGGPGGFNAAGSTAWLNTVTGRGQSGALLSNPTDMGIWGGSVSFDSSGTNWYLGESTSGLNTGQTDFYSVAIHELAHLLGFGIRLQGTATPWTKLVSGGKFIGPGSVQANGSQPVNLDASEGHWAEGTMSQGRETAMDPSLTQGTRKLFTALDLAGLQDIGWEIRQPATVAMLDPSVYVLEDQGAAVFRVTRSSDVGRAQVRVTSTSGTATAGLDFEPLDELLTFAPGETTKFVALKILSDQLAEGTETFTVTLDGFQGIAPGSPITTTITIADRVRGVSNDYDGNGVGDPGVFRVDDARWDIELSNASGAKIGDRDANYGIPGSFAITSGLEPLTDFPIPGDYNGDGITDRALFRIATAEYIVQYLDAQGNVLASRVHQFGFPGNFAIANGLEPLQDIPIPGDYNGDGVYDLAVFRVANAEWIIRFKKPGFDFAGNLIEGAVGVIFEQHGLPGKFAQSMGIPQLVDMPVPGDYNGDGITDFAVYRRLSDSGEQGDWLIRLNDARGKAIGARRVPAVWKLTDNATIRGQGGGIEVNLPVPGDFDGNGVTDVAVWHAPTADWRIVLLDRDGNVLNRNDDGSSNTRRKVFGRRFDATAPAWRRFPDVPIQAPFSSLIKLGILPGLKR